MSDYIWGYLQKSRFLQNKFRVICKEEACSETIRLMLDGEDRNKVEERVCESVFVRHMLLPDFYTSDMVEQHAYIPQKIFEKLDASEELQRRFSECSWLMKRENAEAEKKFRTAVRKLEAMCLSEI